MFHRTGAAQVLLTFSVLFFTGCNLGEQTASEPDRYPVSGTLTLDGQPLYMGWVYFKAEGTPDDRAEIVDGRYEGLAQAGERRVEIYSTRQIKVTDGGMESYVEINDVPNAYNVDSELKVTVQPVDRNSFDFELVKEQPANR